MAARTVADTPGYGAWVYHIARKWKPPPGINAPKIIGFAIIMATFGKNGQGIWPSASTLAKCAHVSERTAQRLRADCVELGLFREAGITGSGIAILEIAIPADYGDHGHDCECGAPECRRRYVAKRAPKGARLMPPGGVNPDTGGDKTDRGGDRTDTLSKYSI
jgi:hypothetical protein